MAPSKQRSSTSKALVVSKRTSTDVVKHQPKGVTEFDGVLGTVDLDYWMQRFERSLFRNKLQKDDDQAAHYFSTFMTGAAWNWLQAQPKTTRTSFKALKEAFFHRFNFSNFAFEPVADRLAIFEQHLSPSLTVQDIQSGVIFDDWLGHLADLAAHFDHNEIAPAILADKAWLALPGQLQKELSGRKPAVAALVEACRLIPKKRYRRLLEREDQEARIRALEATVERFERLERLAVKGPKFDAGRKPNRFTQVD